ncbi:hypothetical protein [Thermococcus sp. 9N3]|uniref:hypothetical protein n=1 Tax=Thermococcus sp. 9N3 TaxID=163002 RepID=UPI00142F718D|nr:hypothetical protein [Thermococcus sp. 9N3]NJE49017.1 hypothetical protein [Thermococcus sp. 9N3]
MRHSRIAVKVLDGEEPVFYDPVYHGRTLKVFGMDDYPVRFLSYVIGEYRKLGYSAVVFDTTGEVEGDFDEVIEVRDGASLGLDPIKLYKAGYFDPYTAVTIVQTLYGLDRSLTDRLYVDVLLGKVSSVPEAVKRNEKYSEVILESYTPLDEALYSGEPPKLEGSVRVNLGETRSITLVGIAFLTLAAAFEKRRETVVGLVDGAVLGYTTAGSAAMPLLTRPLKRRVTVVASQYVLDSLLNIAGPTLLLYHDPDVQSLVYETSGVPPGPTRKFVGKKAGTLITRSPESVDVLHGGLPEGVLR